MGHVENDGILIHPFPSSSFYIYSDFFAFCKKKPLPHALNPRFELVAEIIYYFMKSVPLNFLQLGRFINSFFLVYLP